GVGVVLIGGEQQDALGPAGVDQGDVVGVGRVAGAADDPGGLEVGEFGPDLVLHFDLVAVGEDGDAGSLLAFVGLDQFRYDGEHLVRPSENDGVVFLHDQRASF